MNLKCKSKLKPVTLITTDIRIRWVIEKASVFEILEKYNLHVKESKIIEITMILIPGKNIYACVGAFRLGPSFFTWKKENHWRQRGS